MEIMQLVFSWTQPHTTIKDLTFSFSTRIAMHLTKIVLIQQLKYKTQTSKTGLTLHLTEDRKKPTFYQMFTLFQYSLGIQKKKKICTVLLSFLKYNTDRLRKGTKQPLGFFQDHQVRLKTYHRQRYKIKTYKAPELGHTLSGLSGSVGNRKRKSKSHTHRRFLSRGAQPKG